MGGLSSSSNSTMDIVRSSGDAFDRLPVFANKWDKKCDRSVIESEHRKQDYEREIKKDFERQLTAVDAFGERVFTPLNEKTAFTEARKRLDDRLDLCNHVLVTDCRNKFLHSEQYIRYRLVFYFAFHDCFYATPVSIAKNTILNINGIIKNMENAYGNGDSYFPNDNFRDIFYDILYTNKERKTECKALESQLKLIDISKAKNLSDYYYSKKKINECKAMCTAVKTYKKELKYECKYLRPLNTDKKLTEYTQIRNLLQHLFSSKPLLTQRWFYGMFTMKNGVEIESIFPSVLAEYLRWVATAQLSQMERISRNLSKRRRWLNPQTLSEQNWRFHTVILSERPRDSKLLQKSNRNRVSHWAVKFIGQKELLTVQFNHGKPHTLIITKLKNTSHCRQVFWHCNGNNGSSNMPSKHDCNSNTEYNYFTRGWISKRIVHCECWANQIALHISAFLTKYPNYDALTNNNNDFARALMYAFDSDINKELPTQQSLFTQYPSYITWLQSYKKTEEMESLRNMKQSMPHKFSRISLDGKIAMASSSSPPSENSTTPSRVSLPLSNNSDEKAEFEPNRNEIQSQLSSAAIKRNVSTQMDVSGNDDEKAEFTPNRNEIQSNEIKTYVSTQMDVSGNEKKPIRERQLSELREWLENNELDDYFDVLETNGFESVDALKCMRDEDLDEMGISKTGHRRVMIASIKKL